MASEKTILLRRDFSKGLITEASNLAFPENASTDELNVDITKKGTRKRRKGFDFEESYIISTLASVPADLETAYFAAGRWQTPGGNGNLEFASWQIGDKLYFFNTSQQPVQEEVFTDTRTATSTPIDLTDFNSVGSPGQFENPVTTASGNGFLFVAGEDIDPFYVKYNEDGTITSISIDIKVRDLEGLDDGLDPDERPSSLSNEHHYNLKNQGWFVTGIKETSGTSVTPLTEFKSRNGVYPSNSDVWWRGRGAGGDPLTWENNIKNVDTNFTPSNTEAPKGHYILSAFRRDRAGVSGVTGVGLENFGSSRPSAVGFFAGRVWYAGQQGELHATVFFSQILEGEEEIAKCYQKNDPTSEENSQLLPTDGGTVKIPEAGKVIKLHPFGDWMLVMCSNGIWAVGGGTDNSFTAEQYRIRKVSSVNLISPFTVVDVKGSPLFWSDYGIYAIVPSQVDGSPQAQSLSQQTIQTFYDEEVPKLNRIYASGAYDSINDRVYWIYRSTTTQVGQSKFEYDRLLIFDVKFQAFIPWGVFTGTLEHWPFIAGIIQLPSVGSFSSESQVVDSSENTVVDSTPDNVVSNALSLSAVGETIKFLVKRNPVAGNVANTLNLTNMDFELGNTTGWTTSPAAPSGPFASNGDPILSVHATPAHWEEYHLYFGNNIANGSSATAERTIDLSALSETVLSLIDSGDIQFRVMWDQAGIHFGTNDDYQVDITYKKADDTVITTEQIARTEVPNAIEDNKVLGPTTAKECRKVTMKWTDFQNDTDLTTDYAINNVRLLLTDSDFDFADNSTTLDVTFGDFRRTDTANDWISIFTNGKEPSAYLETGFEYGEEPATKRTAPYVYTYLHKEPNVQIVDSAESSVIDSGTNNVVSDGDSSSLFIQGKWDFSRLADSSKFSTPQQTYRDLKDDRSVVVTRNKVRGRGRSLKLRYYADTWKPFELLGWATEIQKNAGS